MNSLAYRFGRSVTKYKFAGRSLATFIAIALSCTFSLGQQKAQDENSPTKKTYKSKPSEAKKATEQGKVAVANKMKDPASTQFRNLFTRNDYFLCGEVNAKNGCGGYVGFKRFIAMGEVGLVTFDDETVDFQRKWVLDCEGGEISDFEKILIGR